MRRSAAYAKCSTRRRSGGEDAEILSTLIKSVTIYPDSLHGPEAEVVAKLSDLMAFATNDDAAPKGGVSSSMRWLRGQDLNL
jgi:site-specific DNA recombinase